MASRRAMPGEPPASIGKVQSITATCSPIVSSMRVYMPLVSTGLSSTNTLVCVCVLREDVAEVLEARAQRHHTLFTQRVDRRVGDLREVLPEEVRQRAVMVGKDGKGAVIAHRADGFLAVFGHWREDQLDVFHRHAGGVLAAQEFLLLVIEARLGPRTDHRLEFDDVGEPLLVRDGCPRGDR